MTMSATLCFDKPASYRFTSPISRRCILVMDLTTKLNIARTEQRIAIRDVTPKDVDVSEHRRMLSAEKRYLASGCAPPQQPETCHRRHRGRLPRC
jgi:hypothetical protein